MIPRNIPWRLVAAAILVPLFLLLFSYHLVLLFYPQTAVQRETISALLTNQPFLLNFAADEQSHMEDVGVVMRRALMTFAALALFLTVLLKDVWHDAVQRKLILCVGSMSTLIVAGIIFLAVVLSFQSLFVVFHLLFFPQGNWQFSSDSLLIHTFPGSFFIGMTISFFVLALLLAFCILIFAKKLR